MKHFRKAILFLSAMTAVVLLNTAVFAQAFPPAQGPPPTPNNNKGLPMTVIINKLKQDIQTVCDSTNAQIARDAATSNIRAHLSFTPTVFIPMMSTTTLPDRPNQNVILNRFIIKYDVTGIRWHGIPYFSRQLGQSIDVYTSCQNWFTNNGVLTFTSVVQRPFLDGESFAEEALNFFISNKLADYVDSKLRARLKNGFVSAVPESSQVCNCLSVEPGSSNKEYTDGTILYDKIRKRSTMVMGTALNTASVKLQSIKRLNDRVMGEPYYQAVENIQVLFYVNQTARVVDVTGMKEGDERALTVQPVSFNAPGPAETIVLIANITQQQLNGAADTRFAVYNKAMNFGSGIRKVVVQKSFWTPPHRLPDGHMSKPIQSFIDSYELTFAIQLPPNSFIGSQ